MGRRRAAVPAALALLAALAVVVPAATASGEHRAPVVADVGDQLTARRHEHPPGTFQTRSSRRRTPRRSRTGRWPEPEAARRFRGREGDRQRLRGHRGLLRPGRHCVPRAEDRRHQVLRLQQRQRSFEGSATSTDFADLTQQVNNYGDRGLTGIARRPAVPHRRPYVYVNYTYNRDPRDDTPVVPKWGLPGPAYDNCPAPATGRPADRRPPRPGPRQPAHRLPEGHRLADGGREGADGGGCYQFSSHASGDVDLRAGRQALRILGRGRELQHARLRPVREPLFQTRATRAARCGRRTSAARATPSVSTARSSKMDPTRGSRRRRPPRHSWLVAYGQRNPWRLTFRPTAGGCGPSKELWSGDVGASKGRGGQPGPDVTEVSTPRQPGLALLRGQPTSVRRSSPGGTGSTIALRDLYAQGPGRSRSRSSATRPGRRSPGDPRRGLLQRDLGGLGGGLPDRHRATTRRSTRARCSSPTSRAPASGCWARKRTASPTRRRSRPSC